MTHVWTNSWSLELFCNSDFYCLLIRPEQSQLEGCLGFGSSEVRRLPAVHGAEIWEVKFMDGRVVSPWPAQDRTKASKKTALDPQLTFHVKSKLQRFSRFLFFCHRSVFAVGKGYLEGHRSSLRCQDLEAYRGWKHSPGADRGEEPKRMPQCGRVCFLWVSCVWKAWLVV